MLNSALKSIRLYNKLTLSDLAKKLNVSVSHLSEIENGKNTITLEMLKKYSDYFDIPVSHILLFSENINNENKTTKNFRVFIAKKILSVMDWINEKEEKKKNPNTR